jgi:hypothetical protein
MKVREKSGTERKKEKKIKQAESKGQKAENSRFRAN